LNFKGVNGCLRLGGFIGTDRHFSFLRSTGIKLQASASSLFSALSFDNRHWLCGGLIPSFFSSLFLLLYEREVEDEPDSDGPTVSDLCLGQ